VAESSTKDSIPWLARLGHAAWRWSWRAVALVLIGTAVLLTLARLLLPFADQYQAELEKRVESYLGYEVSIGKLDIDWQGLGPRVRMSGLRVHGVGTEGGSILFEQAHVRLRPVLRAGAPGLELADFSLIGFTLRARMDEQGRVHAFGRVLELPALAAKPDDAGGEDANGATAAQASPGAGDGLGDALGRIFSIRRLQIREADIEITRPAGEVVLWRDLGLTLENSGDRHRLAVHVAPPAAVAERLAGRLSFTGSPAAYEQWRASLYLDVRALALERLFALWPDAPVRASGGRLDGRLWSEWDGGRLVEARLEVGADEPALASESGRVAFERLGGRMRLWQPDPGQWQLDATDIEVRRNGRAWDTRPVSYAREDDGDWRVAAGFVRAEDIAAVAGLLPLADELRTRLDRHEPRGDILGLNLAVSAGGDFRMRADFRDLGWSAGGDIPGVTGLDGRAGLRSDGGRVALESSAVDFDAPKLFRDSLHLQELSALVEVDLTADGIRVDAPRVHLRNKDLRGRGRVGIELAQGRSPYLDLQFDYHDGVATAVSRYLPAGIMKAPVVEWLDQAFRAGRVPQGSFILRGAADDFPYRDHDGMFDVRFEVADAALHYGNGWPAIEGLGGRVRFTGPSLQISADRGGTRGLRLERGRARFRDLRDGLLEVELDAAGPLDDMLAVVAGSPLGPRFEPVLDGTSAQGDADLSLELSVPVDDVEATRVAGKVELDGAALSQRAHDLLFDRIRGTVGFTGDSVSIDDLRARLRQRPIRVDADTRDGLARFRLTGRFAPAELLPGDAGGDLLAAVSGRSGWLARVEVPLRTRGDARLLVTSDLEGVRVDLPAPLGKPSAGARRLEVAVPLGGGTISARYGSDARLLLERSDGPDAGMRRAGLAFSAQPRLPALEGLRISGELARLPLAPWLERAAAKGDAGGGLEVVELDLEVGRLDINTHALSDVRLSGRAGRDGAWDLSVASNEATGRIAWPSGGSGGPPVDVRFEWIDLALMERPREAAGAQEALRIENPSRLPALDLHVERLKLADFTLRDFNLLTGSGDDALIAHQIGFRTEHLRVNGQGSWSGGDDARTNVRMVVRSGDFGAGLAEIGREGILEDGDGKVTLDLGWPGLPWKPAVATVSGDVNINIDDGVLTDVKPGAARLLGLFSLEAMPLRSLIQSGLIFSEIKGRVDLADGNAYTRLLKIDSSVGLIKIRGRTGLVARDYDQRIVVHPELSTSLPVLGFLSGGPLGAAAVALLQGVMRNVGKDIEKSGRIEYIVTGSWDDPVIERVGQPDADTGSGGGPPESPR